MEQLPAGNPAPSPRRKGGIGAILAAIVAFVLKFKVVLFLFAKFFGLSWTFLLSLWLYVVIFGWKLGVVIMLVLLAHELGHYFAFRAYGLPARLPAFIPLLGAFTAGAAPEDLEHDAYIALAGPITGLGLAAACYVIGDLNHDTFWFACADLSAFLNLFNMIPVPPFDGGRIVGALWTPLWIAGSGDLRRSSALLARSIDFRSDYSAARHTVDRRGGPRSRGSARRSHDDGGAGAGEFLVSRDTLWIDHRHGAGSRGSLRGVTAGHYGL